MHSIAALGVLLIFSLLSAGVAYPLTCDDCKAILKNKQSVQQELAQKDTELNAAFQNKNFKLVNDLRAKMLELRKKMIEFRSNDEQCEQVCKPDIVKAGECKKLMDEILRLESLSNEADYNKIDVKYRDFQQCHHDLEKLKKSD
jgi:hypothetical protein